MSMQPKTPITLITGSLGSGKTTLLLHLLRHADHRLAVLMNEFGELGIDGRIVELENIKLVELAGGCICCELTGELEAAVRELLREVSPEQILLEATGVAESDALVYEVENLPEIRLDCVVCVVDADTAVRFPEVGRVGRVQIEAADVILVNKVDLVPDDQTRAVIDAIREFNQTPAVFRTIEGNIDPQVLFGPTLRPFRQRARGPKSKGRHQHGELFESFVFKSDALLNRECFERVANTLSSAVFRAKGFIRSTGGGLLFNQVAGRWELEPFDTEDTQLVFIGRGLAPEKAKILSRLRLCEE